MKINISMEVILLYDKLSRNKPGKLGLPLDNGGKGNKCVFYIQCKHRQIKVKWALISSFLRIDPNCLYLYVIPGLGSFQETLNLIPLKSKNILKKHKIPVLLSLPSEGFSFKDFEYWLDRIQYEFYKNDWQDVPKYFLFGNLIMEKVWTDHQNSVADLLDKVPYPHIFQIDKQSKFIRTFACNYFEYSTVLHLKNKIDSKQLLDFKLADILDSQRNIDFLNYNRHLRPHRFALVCELHRLGLLENSYYSLIGGENFHIGPHFIDNVLQYIPQDGHFSTKNFFNNYKPINIEFEDSAVNDIFRSDARHYLDTFFSLVTETEVSEDSLFITEKTFKPIANYHPFIIWGSPGTLEFLRSRGYQTFPELFCEDYDKEYDKFKRFDMIVNEIKKFVNLDLDEKRRRFASIVDKLDHNYKNFYSRPDEFKTFVDNMFTTIYQDQR